MKHLYALLLPTKKQHKLYVILCISIFINIALFFLQNNFKLAIIITLVICIYANLVIKNIKISFLMILLASAFHPFPAKYYPFIIVSPDKYIYPLLPEGIFDHFSFTISDMYALALIIFSVKDFIRALLLRSKLFIKNLNILLSNGYVKAIFVSLLGYSSLLLASSVIHSFYPAFSIIFSLQVSKMIPIAISFLLIFSLYQEYIGYTMFTLIGVIIFQEIGMSIVQITSMQISYINTLSAGINPEENLFFKRLHGPTGQDFNQFAFYLFFLMLVTLPYIITLKNKYFGLTLIIVGLINIALTQSRVTWLSILFCYIMLAVYHRKTVIHLLKKYYHTVYAKALLLVTVLLLCIVIIPRLVSSTEFFNPQSGGGPLRVKMIEDGLLAIQQSPLLGFGAGTSVNTLFTIVPNGYIATLPFAPHFTYIQVAIESGVISVLCLFLPLFLLVRLFLLKLIRKQRVSLGHVFSFLCVTILFVYYAFQSGEMRTEYMFWGMAIGIGSSFAVKSRASI